MDELFDKVKKEIAYNLDIDEAKITMKATLYGDLGLDSLERYELFYAIEQEVGVRIPDHIADGFETVGDVVNYLSNATGKSTVVVECLTCSKWKYEFRHYAHRAAPVPAFICNASHFAFVGEGVPPLHVFLREKRECNDHTSLEKSRKEGRSEDSSNG